MTNAFTTSLEIDATADHVFDYFVRPELLVKWMGDFARLEARDGGIFAVDINGVIIRGHYKRIERPHLIEIAWGEAGNAKMPPGATSLTVRITQTATGTLVRLDHDGLHPAEAEKHAVGWPHFLARLQTAAAGADPGPDPWASQPPSS
ncbi:MAG TPA: SRPBCC domain-containing protein [Steroidobacteraceae bacterium]|nr:SRPBCC domain-containing protein [Steroidobacteraceae bacterium]